MVFTRNKCSIPFDFLVCNIFHTREKFHPGQEILHTDYTRYFTQVLKFTIRTWNIIVTTLLVTTHWNQPFHYTTWEISALLKYYLAHFDFLAFWNIPSITSVLYVLPPPHISLAFSTRVRACWGPLPVAWGAEAGNGMECGRSNTGNHSAPSSWYPWVGWRHDPWGANLRFPLPGPARYNNKVLI